MQTGGAILVIGNEILSGKVCDTNSPFLVTALREIGFATRCIQVIPDHVDTIATAVAALSAEFEQVFTSGGVGPTLDDLTFEGIARAFGVELEEHAELVRIIREHFAERTNRSHLKMAQIPVGSRLSFSEGLVWPVVEIRNVMILPGDPTILRKKFSAVKDRFQRRPWQLVRVYTLQEEGDLAALLDALAERNPEVIIGSYPVYDTSDYKVQITLESKDPAVVDRALADLRSELPDQDITRIE